MRDGVLQCRKIKSRTTELEARCYCLISIRVNFIDNNKKRYFIFFRVKIVY